MPESDALHLHLLLVPELPHFHPCEILGDLPYCHHHRRDAIVPKNQLHDLVRPGFLCDHFFRHASPFTITFLTVFAIILKITTLCSHISKIEITTAFTPIATTF